MWLFWVKGIVLSFVLTAGFGILSNVPVRTLVAGGLIGTGGWLILQLLPMLGTATPLATFIAATAISLASQLLSIYLRVPATNFSVAGVIPIVPGSTAYKSMFAFVNGDYLGGVSLAAQTSISAGGIAAGLILGLSIFQLWKGFVARYAGKRTKAN